MCVIFLLYKHPSSSERVALRPETLHRRKLRLVLLAVFTSVKLLTFGKLTLFLDLPLFRMSYISV